MKKIADIFRSWGVVDDQGRHVGGTDKETNHRYGDAYERLFPDRRSVGLMMEVGVADGSSLLAWRDVFPNARCVGLDVHPADALGRYWLGYEPGSRVELVLGDATVQSNCETAANGRLFDFICEDATHKLEDTLRTLLYLWPYVKPGGLYVVEEFSSIASLRRNVLGLWGFAEIIPTQGPFGGVEPLVAFRKPT